LAYVSFDVIPSKEDDEAALKYIQKLQGEFTQSPSAETEAYVNRNADTPYDLMKNFKKGELKNVKLDSLIYNAQPGFVFGPYAEEGAYKIAKLINFVNTPDTVQASHILIAPDGQKIKDMKDAQRIADSLKVIIDKGGDFAQLAKTYSADKGSAEKGGDLDKFTEGKMVKPFNDACFTGKVKDIKVVETQFGVHIIKIVYQSKIVQKAHIAFVDRKVQPGKKTFQDYYAKASKFASENTDLKKFDAALTKEGLTKKVVTGLTPMSDVIAGLLSPRIIVQWAFKEETEKGNVSEIFDNGDKFIIAVLTDIKEKGIAPLAQKREEIVQLLRKEKKAAQFVKEMSGNQTLEALAGKGLQILEARNISFSSASLPDGGQEPVVIATAVATAKDKTTAPIIGTNGVYVLKVNTITGIQDLAKADVSNDKLSAQNRIQGRGTREGYDALKKVANVVDDRAKFF